MTYNARIIALALALNVLMGTVVIKASIDNRSQHEADALITTQNVSRLVSEQLEGDLDLADAALRVVTDEVNLQATSGKISRVVLEAQMKRLLERNPTLLNFRVSDPKGDLIYGFVEEKNAPPVNIADRAYFSTLRDTPQAGLVVSDPIKGKISGKVVMVLARRIQDTSGAFGGVALVSYDAEVINKKLAALALGGKAVITVRSDQLAVIARHPPGNSEVNKPGSTKISDVFPKSVQKSPMGGSFSTTSKDSIDGIPRLHSYVRNQRYPLYVNVGIAESDYLGLWRLEVRTMAITWLIFALTSTFGVVMLQKAWRRRRQTERELQHQRDQLQNVVWSASLGTWQWNVTSGEATFNQRMAEIVGFDPQEMNKVSNATWASLTHPHDIQRYKDEMRRCLKRQTDDFQFESRVRHQDGHYVWVLDRGRVVEWSIDGKALLVTGTRQDISDRKLAEERQIHAVLDAAPDGAMLVGNDGSILYANAKAASIFAFGEDEIAGMQVEALVPEQKRSGHIGLRKGLTDHPHSGQKMHRNSVQGLRKDGSVFPAEISLNPFALNYETVMIASITDITQRLATQQTLRDDEVKLRKAQEIGNFGSYMTNLQTGRWESSAQLDAIFGIDEKFEHDIPHWNTLLHPDYAQLALDHYYDVIRDRKDFRIDYEIVRPADGVRRWVAANGELEYAPDGTPIRLIGTIQDITERKAIEAELRQANETLEQNVEQRTAELKLALEAAERAKQSRGEFLAKMSHEIRTPMNAVLGLVYLALQKQPSPEVSPFLEKIRQSGQHLLSIINDILDFTKIDAGKLELESGVVDIEQVVQHVELLTEGKAAEKGLRLSSGIAPDVPRKLHGDSLRIAQILINYTNNAIKFTERGSIALNVHCLSHEAKDSRKLVCFEVRDTGMGVTEEQRTRLFQDFEQADNSTTRKFGGTGLGLSISKQLATLMGGEVGVTSTPGNGSTFWFTALLAPADDGVAAEIAPAVTDLPALLAGLRGKRVLVVDDNSLNLEVAQGVLEGVGVHVAQACDGALALDILRSGTFDCVLMDVHMPVMDGLEATRRIRTDPELAHLPVLAMTANARREDHMECLQAGMNDVLMKPFDPDHLFITLARWTGGSNPHTDTAAHVVQAPVKAAATASTDALPEWDISYLQRIVGNNMATQRRLLEKFQLSARELVPAVDFAIATLNLAEAKEQAHKLKSSARAVGAMRLGALCQSMEDASKADQPQDCRRLATAMTDALASVDAKISAYLATA